MKKGFSLIQRSIKPVLVFCFSAILCFGWLGYGEAAYSLLRENVTTEPVAAGVTLQTFNQETDQGHLNIYVLNVDLTNPYVKVEPLIGADNRSFDRASTVLNMAKTSGAVAAINGDYFHMKEGKHPLGFAARDGEVLTTPMLWGDFHSFALTRDLSPFIGRFSLTGEVRVTLPDDGESASFVLSGINKPRYSALVEGTVLVSDTNRLQLYNRVWGPLSRGAQSDLPGWTEVVVSGDTVQEVRVDQPPVAIPLDGFVLCGHGEAADFLQGNCFPGVEVDVDYTITPLDKEIQAAVGGKDLLVVDGWTAPSYSKDLEGKFARSAVAYSRDGKQLYLVAVEGSKNSRGMYMGELAKFMVDRLGAWYALNLDGGGSTSLVSRPLGETAVVPVNVPAYGTPRPVPISLGVFSTAPAGNLSGLLVKGPSEIVAGFDYAYSVRGYDQYYNPVPVDAGSVTWRVVQGEGSFADGKLTATKGGTLVLEAEAEGVRQSYTVNIIGTEDLAGIKVEPDTIRLNPGEATKLTAKLCGKDGRTWALGDKVHWDIIETQGNPGTISSDGLFTAGAEDAVGVIKASFLDLTAEVPVTVGMPVPQDVRGHWAQPQIKELLARKIVLGYPDGSFRPDQPVTRGEFVTILSGALGWQKGDGVELPFKDEIPAWALPGLQAAYERGVVGGFPDGTFRTYQKITRVELAALMAGALKLPEPEQPISFKDDARIPAWGQDAVQSVAAAGLMRGNNGYFRPLDTATRAEVAAILYQVLPAVQ
jgi:hypothetical protein